MRIKLRTLKSLIAEAIDQNPKSALNSYVKDSRATSAADKATLATFVKDNSLPALDLERVESKLPDWAVGDVIKLPLTSFTTVKLSQNKRAGQISWKSSDKAMVSIPNATRGWRIDYDVIDVMFDASDENEVLVSGKYKVTEIKKVPEPGTLLQYGYLVPMYVLEEA